jgi:hypothetical protein
MSNMGAWLGTIGGGLAAGFCSEIETASRRQSATTRVWGSIGSAEIFAEGIAHTTHNDKVERAPRWTGQIQAGRGGRRADDGPRSVCGRVERPPPKKKGSKKKKKTHHLLLDGVLAVLSGKSR